MTRATYHHLRGWDAPLEGNANEPGYLVEYVDGGTPNHSDFAGFISWSPKAVFERGYTEIK